MNRFLMRKLENEPTIEAMFEELNDAKSVGFSEKLPSISVGSKKQPKDVIAVKFVETQPEVKEVPDKKHQGKTKKYQWIKVELLAPHEGYDSESDEVVQLKKGDIASMNLQRHANLASWAKGIGDLKDRSFLIGTVAMVETAKGNNCMDYKIKEVTGEM